MKQVLFLALLTFGAVSCTQEVGTESTEMVDTVTVVEDTVVVDSAVVVEEVTE